MWCPGSESAKTVTNVMKRNGFDLFIVDSLAFTVLNMSALIFSLALAAIPWLAMITINPPDPIEDSYYAYTGALCGVALVLGMVVLGSFSGIVLNAATTLFICYVADRDAATHGAAYGGGGGGELVLAAHVQKIHENFEVTHKPKLEEVEAQLAGGGIGPRQ